MESRRIQSRKFLLYYRKSKFRKIKKVPAFKLGSLNGGMVGTDRETIARQPLKVRNSFNVRGWMGIGRVPFIALAFVVCIVPCVLCFPLENGVRPEISETQVTRKSSVREADFIDNRTLYPGPSENVSRTFFENPLFINKSNENGNPRFHYKNLTNWIVHKENGKQRLVKRHIRDRSKRKPLFVTDDVVSSFMDKIVLGTRMFSSNCCFARTLA